MEEPSLESYGAHVLDNPGLDYALYVIALQHAKSFSLNIINSSISIWKKNTIKYV
jgi:hypothetical protein